LAIRNQIAKTFFISLGVSSALSSVAIRLRTQKRWVATPSATAAEGGPQKLRRLNFLSYEFPRVAPAAVAVDTPASKIVMI
jgi:hypothetical protein